MGPQIRTGALDAAGRIVDLAGGVPRRAARRGARRRTRPRASARRCCRATWSTLIEGGGRSLDAARRALQWAADEGPDGDGVPIVYPAEDGCVSCRRCPGRRCCAISWGSRRTCSTSSRSWGARFRRSGTSCRCTTRATPAASAAHGDDIPIPSYGDGARHRVRAGDGHRAGRHQHPAGARAATTSSAT